MRGTRLSDLALTNIELIDRNLYERSCDVRWWATDSSIVTALVQKTPDAMRDGSRRLGIILDSYTVYFDLVLCDLSNKVIASGRPEKYRSEGTDCSQAAWFRAALASKFGTEFGFESVHASPLVNGQRVLAYSAAVRTGGSAQGEPIGVLGILFNWDALAQTIVENTPVEAERKSATRICIVDEKGRVLADTHDRQLRDTLDLREIQNAVGAAKGYAALTFQGTPCMIGYAQSPGYETYATGWHSVLIQE